MLESATNRYVIRSALVGVAAANASLIQALVADGSIDGGDGLLAGLLGVASALAYAGIGRGTNVEPSIGGGK